MGERENGRDTEREGEQSTSQAGPTRPEREGDLSAEPRINLVPRMQAGFIMRARHLERPGPGERGREEGKNEGR